MQKRLPKEEEPDPLDDPEAYKKWVKETTRRELRAEQDSERKRMLEDSRSQMLELKDDYEDKEKIFEILTFRDKSLVEKMLQSPNPAKFAYDHATAYVDSVMPKVSKEEKEEVVEELVKDLPNLAKMTAQTSNKVEVSKEEDIDDVFADMKY